MPDGRYFSSKLLLFGEYTLISGSKALALPLYNFKGRLARSSYNTYKTWNLAGFTDYIISSPISNLFDAGRLIEAKTDGMEFDSDIPVGYGVGSSGALCAAFYQEFALNPIIPEIITTDNLTFLKDTFSTMESYFHGRSSGIDPLVSYAGRPLKLNKEGSMEFISFDNNALPFRIYLYDSGIYAETSALVKGYLEKMGITGYKDEINERYIPLIDSIIDSFGKRNITRNELFSLSRSQLELFGEMIPDPVRPVWSDGLNSGDYCFKLCGSGGGGYFIVFVFADNIQGEFSSRLTPARLSQ